MFACTEEHRDNLVEFNLIEGEWKEKRVYGPNNDKLIQLAFSQDSKHVVATFMFGYKVWNLRSGKLISLLLPDNGVRNISTRLLESNSCVLSKDSVYAIAGVR